DGIRDKLVTGVQTCALPICLKRTIHCLISTASKRYIEHLANFGQTQNLPSCFPGLNIRTIPDQDRPRPYPLQPFRQKDLLFTFRSEERRVGKECSSHWSPAT